MKFLLRPTLFFILFFWNPAVSLSQNQSFPANKVYPHGFMATNRSGQDAVSNYAIWKTNFLESCSNNRYRVKFDTPSQTVSEGIAYGMLLTVYATDKAIFDGLWNYYKDHRNANGVMNWKINGCSGVIGNNGATDAELDAAMALIVADYQWGTTGAINYRADASALISAIKNKEIELNTFVIKPGDAFGGSSLTNPSYLSPAYCRAFGVFTNDVVYWDSVAAKCYNIIENNLVQNNAVGALVSDWCQANGNYSNQASGYVNQGRTYNYDAARTPWRIATDYVWYGTSTGKNLSKKASDFVRVNLGGSQNVKDGYNQNGTLIGQWHNATFVGAFAAAAMGGDNQAHLDNSYADLKNLNEPSSYFNHTLKTLYLFLLSGNFYLPPPVLLSTTTVQGNQTQINLFPNPNLGEFTIQAPIFSKIKVTSIDGKVIVEKETLTETSLINLSNNAPGIYLVQIESDGKNEIKKVIIN